MKCPHLHIVPAVSHTITQEGNIPVQSIEENLNERQMLHLCQDVQSQQIQSSMQFNFSGSSYRRTVKISTPYFKLQLS